MGKQEKTKTLRAIRLHPRDNVATALTDVPAGAAVWLESETAPVEVTQDIAFGHKFALGVIHRGENVYKYGVTIGVATGDIHPGEHIHLHNLRSLQKKVVDDDAGLPQGEWKNRNS